MADNFTLNAGSGGVDLWTDEVAGPVHAQVVKLADGTADSATVIAAGGGVEAGALRVTIASDSTGVLSIDDNGGAITVDNADITTIAGAVSGTEMQVDIVTSALPTGAATAANQSTANTALAGIQTAVEILDNAISGTEMQVDLVSANVTNAGTFAVQVSSALPAGTNAIGKLSANSGVDIGDVDVLSIAAGTNTIGDVGLTTRTAGGVSVFYDNDLDETAVVVNASPGQVYFIHAINLHTAPLYLQLFNVAQGSVTVGTTTPTMQFVIPSQGDANGAGFTLAIPQGIAFGTAITAAASTNSEGNGAPGANLCHVNIGYS